MGARKKLTPEERIRNRKESARKYKKKNWEREKEYQRNYNAQNYKGTFEKKIKKLIHLARDRSKKSGLKFDITENDLVKVDRCPLLGVAFDFSASGMFKYNSPTIDRINPNLGYVRGNVWVISHRANRIKNNATLKEFGNIYKNWKKHEEERDAKRKQQLCLFDDPSGSNSST